MKIISIDEDIVFTDDETIRLKSFIASTGRVWRMASSFTWFDSVAGFFSWDATASGMFPEGIFARLRLMYEIIIAPNIADPIDPPRLRKN